MKIVITRKLGQLSVAIDDKGTPRDLPVELAAHAGKPTTVTVYMPPPPTEEPGDTDPAADAPAPPAPQHILEITLPMGYVGTHTSELELAGAGKYPPLTGTHPAVAR